MTRRWRGPIAFMIGLILGILGAVWLDPIVYAVGLLCLIFGTAWLCRDWRGS